MTFLGDAFGELVCETGSSRQAEVTVRFVAAEHSGTREYDLFHAPSAYYATVVDLGRRLVIGSVLVLSLEMREHMETGLKTRAVYRMTPHRFCVDAMEHAASRLEAEISSEPRRIVLTPLVPAASWPYEAAWSAP